MMEQQNVTVEQKSEDKKEIEDEEREKMLNEENKRESQELESEKKLGEEEESHKTIKTGRKEGEGEVEKMRKALEEEAEKDSKRKIPIGGIKIPGFLRSRSREKTKEGEGDLEEGKDLLNEPPCTAVNVHEGEKDTPQDKEASTGPRRSRLPSLKLGNPFARKSKEQSVDQVEEVGASPHEDSSGGKRAGLLDAIKLPLVSVLPRKFMSKEKDLEIGTAGLASMETLDDSVGPEKMNGDPGEDGMESVKLDTEDKVDPEKGDRVDGTKQEWRERIRMLSKFKLIVVGVIIFILLLIVIIIVTAVGPHRAPTTPPLEDGKFVKTQTSCGIVEGLFEDGAFVFRGIPYAVPPVGERRFMPAKPLESLEDCWVGTLPAHNSSLQCWQMFGNGILDGTEDCLTLDIFTPKVSYDSPLPVVVLLGADTLVGGGLLRASTKLARSRDVVFVRPNFRLGVLGFLAAEPLKKAIYPPTSGNYGLSDIVTALRWIQLNIEHFGGDKTSVTLLGHRAGATLATALTASREARGLFQRAWVASGSSIFPGRTLDESERDNANYLDKLSCEGWPRLNAVCLQTLDVEDLLDKVPEPWRYPVPDLPQSDEDSAGRHEWLVLDGVFLQEHLSDVWKNGSLHVKLVVGTTSHADIPHQLKEKHADWNANDGSLVEQHVSSSVLGRKGMTEEVLRRYGRTWQGLVSMISDLRTVCPLLTLARAQQNVPFYVVTQPRGGDLADVGSDVDAILGRYEPRSLEQRRYVTAMQQLFYRFVWHGELKNEESDKRKNNDQVLLIGQDSNPSQDFPNCDYWVSNDMVPRHARID